MHKHNSHNSQKNKAHSKSSRKKDFGQVDNSNKNPLSNQTSIEVNKEQR